jgi:MarR family transcriptional regulator, organic hydroperoxide resistance regulator
MAAAGSSAAREALAAEVWRRLFDLIIRTRAERDRVLAPLGLTPNDSRALWALDPRQGRTMKSLAEAWECDASNVTWIVDGLERRGLAERRAAPGDRRVKLVALTPQGTRVKAELTKGIYRPPAELLALDVGVLEALRSALARLPADADATPSPVARRRRRVERP